MYKSRKASSLYDGDFSLCDVVLTKHAKRRCKERHIKPINVQDACAIIKGRYVVTAWQKQPANYGVHCTKGIDYMRKTNRDKVIPKEVLEHVRQPKKSSVRHVPTIGKSKKPKKSKKSKKGRGYVKWYCNTNHRLKS